MAREFSTVGVVGLGTMGAGIAEVFARHGLAVVAVERDRRRSKLADGTSRTPPGERSAAESSARRTKSGCSPPSPSGRI